MATALEFKDLDQNRYFISVNGYCFIELKGKVKKRVRRIARLLGEEIIKKENGNGIHRKTMSFGFPYELLKRAQLRGAKRAVVVYKNSVFITNIEKFFSKGFVLFFKDKAERRIYLPIGEFKELKDAKSLRYYSTVV
jgi:hypothetical protein